MKIAIVGSREFKDIDFAKSIIEKCFVYDDCWKPDIKLVSGGARGIDTLAEKIVDDLNKYLKEHPNLHLFYDKIIFKADWNKYGTRAGAIRNQQIVDEADYIIAFWDGESKGTKITIDMAIKTNKPIDIYIRK